VLKKMTIANLNVEKSLKKDELMHVGGSISDMPMPKNYCLHFCSRRCGIKKGSNGAHESGQDYYQD